MRIILGRLVPVVALVAAAGCAEPIRVKSWPASAKIYIDDQYIGTSPARLAVPRSQVGRPHTWRVEYRNCDVAEGRAQTRVAGRRIAGYIFTLGIVAMFKGPHEFIPVDVALQGGDCEGPPTAANGSAPSSGITIQQIVGDHNAAAGVNANESKTRQLAERLTTLRDLYNRKLITSDVYEQEMQKAVRELK